MGFPWHPYGMWISRFLSGWTEILFSDGFIINYASGSTLPFCSLPHDICPLYCYPLPHFLARLYYNAQIYLYILRPSLWLQWWSEVAAMALCIGAKHWHFLLSLWTLSCSTFLVCVCIIFFSSAESLVLFFSLPPQGMSSLPLSSCYPLVLLAAWIWMCVGMGCHLLVV